MAAIAPTWTALPAEMKLAIVDALNDDDIVALAKVDMRSYQACVPSLFRKVKLDTFEALEQFLEAVPRAYLTHIKELYLCTANRPTTHTSTPVLPRVRADAVIALLSATPRLAKLALITHGSLDKSVLAPFPYLQNLRELSIANCGDEKMNPLSERLVVSMALSIPHLSVLSLDRITRSKLHAPDLLGKFTPVPLSLSDSDIPHPPHLDTTLPLSLPSLLLIPTLRRLTIRDTHLGDPRWSTVPVLCKLGVLDLGSCYHESENFNTRCTERIMAAVGQTVSEFSLTAAISDSSVFAHPHATPLARLRRLHISPYFPIESVVDTVANLAGSPVERISVQCFEEDVVDVCGALEEFLSLRVERGAEFYQNLQRIDVSVTTDSASSADDDDDDEDDDDEDADMHGGSTTSTEEEIEERNRAARHLLEFCKDLQLASVVGKVSNDPASTASHRSRIGTSFEAEAFSQNQKMDIFSRPISEKSMDTFTSFTDVKRFHTKGRSMSL